MLETDQGNLRSPCMEWSDLQNARMAMIAMLSEKVPGLGRTALMKLCYFSQQLRRVPLGYHFTLYAYGPFDSDVLADLDAVEALGGVKSRLVRYPSTYGYQIEAGERSFPVQEAGQEFLEKHRKDMEWVVSEFANLTAADLELVSTIVYVDSEIDRVASEGTLSTLVQLVQDVKPHFTEPQIRRRAEELLAKGILSHVIADFGPSAKSVQTNVQCRGR